MEYGCRSATFAWDESGGKWRIGMVRGSGYVFIFECVCKNEMGLKVMRVEAKSRVVIVAEM